MDKIYIKNIEGNNIKVTDIDKAIQECEMGKTSPYKMQSGKTVGQNYKFMLRQLQKLKK